MNQTRKHLSILTTAALLTALAILIPQVMPKIVIPPASFTLASHVPIMIGMLISPAVAVHCRTRLNDWFLDFWFTN